MPDTGPLPNAGKYMDGLEGPDGYYVIEAQ